jgi:hypothetical protein
MSVLYGGSARGQGHEKVGFKYTKTNSWNMYDEAVKQDGGQGVRDRRNMSEIE